MIDWNVVFRLGGIHALAYRIADLSRGLHCYWRYWVLP